ncbi:hypothetical protein AURDEDRAFT_117097 [Auricularia subglabra TFB-10046 SS5]|uniref:F-box domain-containing protein n=1 Tax=Auricularia subglabra (strain TFB-10046 / SS5) TaxID=717982 RepID=J0D9I9_AURST|nr:hypothetical protein AURDEDRAFT_117097 [Auricularia subglabra TFB-10046 SS5]
MSPGFSGSSNGVGPDPLIARLHTDALTLVFLTAHEDAFAHNQKSALELPLTLTHVCRRWRALALAQPRLWTNFFWSPRESVAAALAMLDRAAGAPLAMRVSLGASIPNPLSDAARAAGHVVFNAVLLHLWHTVELDLSFCADTLESGHLTPLLFADVPYAMPRLRALRISLNAIGYAVQDLPRLNLACPQLASVALGAFRPRSLLGPATHLQMGGPMKVGELRRALQRAPNLRSLSLLFCDLTPGDAEGPPFDHQPFALHLADLTTHSLTLSSMRALETLELPLGRIQSVTTHTLFSNTPFSAAYDFLRVGELADVDTISIALKSLSVSTSAGLQRTFEGFDMSLSATCMQDLFHASPLLLTLRELTVGLEIWAEVLGVIVDTGATSLPRLEQFGMYVAEDDFSAADDDEEAVLRNGIFAPSLARIVVTLRGQQLPTRPLVRLFLLALGSVRSPAAPALPAGGITIAEDHRFRSDRVAVFSELLRDEIGARIRPPGPSPDLPERSR